MGYPSTVTCGACGMRQQAVRDEERTKLVPCKQCRATLEVAPGAMATYATFMGDEAHAADRTLSAAEVEARLAAAREERMATEALAREECMRVVALARAKRLELGIRAEVDHVYGLRDLVMADLASREPEGGDFDLPDKERGQARRAAMGGLAAVLGLVYGVALCANDVGEALGRQVVLAHHDHRHAQGAWSLVLDAVDVCQAMRPPFPGLIMGTPIDEPDFVGALQGVYRGRTAYRAALVQFIVKAIEALLGGPQPTITSSELLDWRYDDRQLDPYREETYV